MTKLVTVITLALISFLSIPSTKLPNYCNPTDNQGSIYFVSLTGHDYKGKGTRLSPWRSIEFAIYKAKENSTILVKPGHYKGAIRVKKAFKQGLLIKSEIPYAAKLTNNGRVLAIVGQAANITIEGFEITHSDKNANPLVVHIDGYGTEALHNITLKNNIIHDSFNNDLLKINNGANNIFIQCNMFYNQGDSDEHIDANSVKNVIISDNVFFNDFPQSKRIITKKSSSYIVVKDSNAKEDPYLGAENVTITRNIFLNWQGSHGHGFVLIGEDGKPYFEANNITISNNIMIGNSPIEMRSPFGVKGAHNVYFYQNTIFGDLPSSAYALRINTEGKNPTNNNIQFYYNIWSDPYGTMGQGAIDMKNNFSDTFFYQLDKFTLAYNLYWNGGNDLPHSILAKVNIKDDKHPFVNNPKLMDVTSLTTPVWQNYKQAFNDGSFTIRETFLRIVYLYASPQSLPTLPSTNKNFSLSSIDILGKTRSKQTTVGAIEINKSTSR